MPVRFAILRIVAGIIVTVLVTFLVAQSPIAGVHRVSARGRQSQVHLGCAGWRRVFQAVQPRHHHRPWATRNTVTAVRCVVVLEWPHRAGARAGSLGVECNRVRSVSGAAIRVWKQSAECGAVIHRGNVVHDLDMVRNRDCTPVDSVRARPSRRHASGGPARESLPSMMLLGGSLRRYGLVALLSVLVIIVGIAAGALFRQRPAYHCQYFLRSTRSGQ